MKKLIPVIIVLGVISLSCKTNKYISFTYSVVTRGFKLETVITKETTTITQQGSTSKSKTIKTDKTLWKFLVNETSKIDLNGISTLEAPTNKRHIDAAMFASLTIATKDSIYRSNSFDAGHPPSTIKTVVDALVKESEKINEK
ncbi:MAG TPA: hypothetical protein EYG85_09615 [Crocinitomix sp.]|nr:hypothetical protein [Crocinitomix sp.]